MLIDKLGNAISNLTNTEEDEDDEEEDEDEEEEDDGLNTAVIIGGSVVALGVGYWACKKFGVFKGLRNHFEGKLSKTLSEEGREIVDSEEIEEFRKWKESQNKETEETTEETPAKGNKKDKTAK